MEKPEKKEDLNGFPLVFKKVKVLTNNKPATEDRFEDGMVNGYYQTAEFHPSSFHRPISKSIDLNDFEDE